jgi:RNA polymerase sigma-70 factor, ECF subfamily
LEETPGYPISVLDEKSFELLFKEHFKEMVYFAQRYVKDLDTAKEMVTDTFVSLWEKRESIDLSKPVRSWITTTIHNKSLNYLRDNKKFDKNILAVEHLDQEPDRLHDQMVSEETSAFVHKTIDELPEKCREIFVMNRFDGLKYQEIADKLGISVKTVETQMSKALQHMRTKLLPYLKVLLLAVLVNSIK